MLTGQHLRLHGLPVILRYKEQTCSCFETQWNEWFPAGLWPACLVVYPCHFPRNKEKRRKKKRFIPTEHIYADINREVVVRVINNTFKGMLPTGLAVPRSSQSIENDPFYNSHNTHKASGKPAHFDKDWVRLAYPMIWRNAWISCSVRCESLFTSKLCWAGKKKSCLLLGVLKWSTHTSGLCGNEASAEVRPEVKAWQLCFHWHLIKFRCFQFFPLVCSKWSILRQNWRSWRGSRRMMTSCSAKVDLNFPWLSIYACGTSRVLQFNLFHKKIRTFPWRLEDFQKVFFFCSSHYQIKYIGDKYFMFAFFGYQTSGYQTTTVGCLVIKQKEKTRKYRLSSH